VLLEGRARALHARVDARERAAQVVDVARRLAPQRAEAPLALLRLLPHGLTRRVRRGLDARDQRRGVRGLLRAQGVDAVVEHGDVLGQRAVRVRQRGRAGLRGQWPVSCLYNVDRLRTGS